jgi:hypothetical protein
MAATGQYTGGTPTSVGYLSTTAFDPVLRDAIAPSIRSLVNEQYPGFKYFKARTNDPWEGEGAGRRLVLTLETALNGAVGFIPEGSAIFGAGKGAYSNHELRQKYFYAVMALTGQVIKATKNTRGAIVSALTRETKGVVRRSLLEFQRCLWGNGTGILCQRTNALASTTVNLVTTYGSNFPTSTRHLLKGTQVMWGSIAQLATNTAPYCNGYGVITSVDSASQFTVGSVVGNNPAANDFFVTGGGTALMLYDPLATGIHRGVEFMGLRGFGNRYRGTGTPAATTHDPSLIQGLVGAGTTPDWNGQVLDLVDGANATHVLTEEDLIRACDQAFNETGNPLNTWFMTAEVRRQLLAALLVDRSFVNPGGTFQGGAKKDGVKFDAGYGQVEIVVDRLAFPNEIVMIDPDCFFYSWSQPAAWWDADGRILRMTPGSRKDEVEGMYYTYGEMGTLDRRQIMRVRDISAT